ncbi:hypothetical protein [Muricoccus aerilatus]|uniref:hypothetical protein n=1 Tax=Muricoccus aerilatus TaxID=452982 RepID=UPI0012EB1244|nr:hypothetical protein [Roseomonas aerilata]
MNDPPDFDFAFGKGRYLKGRGWRGIVALALLLMILLIAAGIGIPLLQGGLKLPRIL